MTVSMMNGTAETVGAVTSGGTESIIMALKAYRDRTRVLRPDVRTPEILAPLSVHPAFDKGCQYFGMKLVHVPLGADFKVDLKAMRKAITPNTILLVGSTPSYPHGMIDPIPEIAALAREFDLPLHVDACLGGFLLPWMKKLGYPDIPVFDFTLNEVTSMSADTHKYGYASKGTSVVMFRNKDLRKYMYFVQPDWTGGMYASPTMAGSRPGGLVAACYASLVTIGEEGFLKASDSIAKAAQKIAKGLREIPGLYLIGDPKAQVVAFGSSDFDIFKLMDALKKNGWVLNALQRPNSLHICVTQRHVDVADDFVRDVREAVEQLKKNPSLFGNGGAAVYGLAAALPERTIVGDIVTGVLDAMLKA
jgi:sphinganine-1-phosphate aldolase